MNHDYWYLSRAAGFTAYLLLTASVVLGLCVRTRVSDRLVRRNTSFDQHRFTALLGLAFTLFHIYILLGDAYFRYTFVQLSLPFLSPYRPVPVAIGVFGLWVMLLVSLSFYVRRRIGYRTWRLLHYATFGLYISATFHGVLAGTDSGETWAKAIYVGSLLVVLPLLVYRVQYRLPSSPRIFAMRLISVTTFAAVTTLLAVRALLSSGATPQPGLEITAVGAAAKLPAPGQGTPAQTAFSAAPGDVSRITATPSVQLTVSPTPAPTPRAVTAATPATSVPAPATPRPPAASTPAPKATAPSSTPSPVPATPTVVAPQPTPTPGRLSPPRQITPTPRPPLP